jgi:hypothetical protein
MLKALREATRSYSETSISVTEVVFPFALSKSLHLDLVSAASLVSPCRYQQLVTSHEEFGQQ